MSAPLNVFGWPPNDEQLPPLVLPTCYSSAQAVSPPTTTSPVSSDSPSDPEPVVVRRGDPSWVARPRNPFIIFRCQYSRLHTKEGKRIRRRPGSLPAEKSLSKRAAEAWHQLSDEDKERFKLLADREREEHARLYPNYRFRPLKRSGALNKRSSAGSTPVLPPAHEGRVTAPVPRYPVSSQALPGAASPMSVYVDPYSLKQAPHRRRSSSESSLIAGQQQQYFMEIQPPRLGAKRSQSLPEIRPPFPPPAPPQLYHPPYELQWPSANYLEDTGPSYYYLSEESYNAAEEAFSEYYNLGTGKQIQQAGGGGEMGMYAVDGGGGGGGEYHHMLAACDVDESFRGYYY